MLKFGYQVSGIPGVGVTADTMAFKDSSISNTLQQEFSGICVQRKMQWYGVRRCRPPRRQEYHSDWSRLGSETCGRCLLPVLGVLIWNRVRE